jgi:hypothetical protein
LQQQFQDLIAKEKVFESNSKHLQKALDKEGRSCVHHITSHVFQGTRIERLFSWLVFVNCFINDKMQSIQVQVCLSLLHPSLSHIILAHLASKLLIFVASLCDNLHM